MYSILRGDYKDRNADTDQNAGTTIWDFYGTGSDKTPNRSHLLENLVFVGAWMLFIALFILTSWRQRHFCWKFFWELWWWTEDQLRPEWIIRAKQGIYNWTNELAEVSRRLQQKDWSSWHLCLFLENRDENKYTLSIVCILYVIIYQTDQIVSCRYVMITSHSFKLPNRAQGHSKPISAFLGVTLLFPNVLGLLHVLWCLHTPAELCGKT